MKRLLLILFLVLLAGQAKAQIGFRGGISQTSDYFSSLFQDGRTGFHLGGFHQFNFNKWLCYRSELQYNQKGYKIRGRIAENTITSITTF